MKLHLKSFVNTYLPLGKHVNCGYHVFFYVNLLLQTYTDSSLQRTESSQHTETNHHITGGDICHPNMNGVCDVADDRDSSIQDGRMTADKDDYKRSISGNRHGKIVSCMYSKYPEARLPLQCVNNKEHFPDFSLGRAEQQSNSKSETNTTSGIIYRSTKITYNH